MLIFNIISSHKTAFALAALVLIIIAGVVIWLTRKPSNNRNWNTDQQVLANADIQGNLVNIHNIRNFTYRSETDYTPGYYDKTFDVNKIKRVYYVVEPFTSFQGPAHTFLTFEFEDNNFVAVSIEIRKRQGQTFSSWKSAFPYYELMYVVADENDVVKLRSNYRKDKVFMYPVKADKAAMRNLFLDYINRVNQLYSKPEFYNLFYDTCTTNIVDSVNRATGTHIPWSYKLLLPSFSDQFALDLGLLDINLPLDQARQKYQINSLAEQYGSDPNFSVKIRQNMQ
jgi:hypothetical protein